MRLCVFCGSNAGHDSLYIEMARSLGEALARNKIDLVYGGASVGLMGAVADATLENGGQAIRAYEPPRVIKRIKEGGR